MALFKIQMRKIFQTALRKIQFKANYGSALYITGDKAIEVCAILTPHVDFEERLSDIDNLKSNVNRRKLNIDVDKLKDAWDFFLKLRQTKEMLEEKKMFYVKKIKEIYETNVENPDSETETYKLQNKLLKEDMQNLKVSLWSIEENVMLKALEFPNIIHKNTPNSEIMEIHSFREKPDSHSPIHHMKTATKHDLLSFTSPHSYYLKNDAAIFELCGKYYFSDSLRSAGFVQFSNSDFVKSVVVEGCGLNHTNPDSVFILHHTEDTKLNEDLRLHLVGGGSLLSFAAYHAKNIFPVSTLPLRYFTLGRQYRPVPMTSELGLLEVGQSSVVETFIAVNNASENLDIELDKVIKLVTDIYKNIGYHFRVCYLPATQIKKWESLRVSYQMFSPFLNDYVEVGNISVSDDYISKRLQILYREGKIMKFPKIISGTILNIPKFLGCVLEQKPESSFKIPTILRNAL